MALYQLTTGNNLSPIKESFFRLEKDLQSIFEKNLNLIASLEFVSTEFIIKNRRIDTLAFNRQSKSFVIIEYKRTINKSVIDQGYAYLSQMLEHQSDFILEYQEKTGRKLSKSDVDWTQSRVMFVAAGFTDMQKEANNFNDIPIELWEVKKYAKDIISISDIKKSKSAGSVKTFISKDDNLKKVSEVIIVYTEEDLLSKSNEAIVELYELFKESICGLKDNIQVKAGKIYIAFKRDNRNICDIEPFSKSLLLWINMKKGTLNDPKHIMEDCSEKGHHGNGDYQVKLTNNNDLEYILSLIKQAL